MHACECELTHDMAVIDVKNWNQSVVSQIFQFVDYLTLKLDSQIS